MHSIAKNETPNDWESKYYYGCHPRDETDKPTNKAIAFPMVGPDSLFCNLAHIYECETRVRIFTDGKCFDKIPANVTERHYNGRYALDLNGYCAQEGYIRSSKEYKILTWNPYNKFMDSEQMKFYLPIICALKTSNRGFVIRPQEIVRIDYSNINNGGIIWQHPDFEVVDGEMVRKEYCSS